LCSLGPTRPTLSGATDGLSARKTAQFKPKDFIACREAIHRYPSFPNDKSRNWLATSPSFLALNVSPSPFPLANQSIAIPTQSSFENDPLRTPLLAWAVWIPFSQASLPFVAWSARRNSSNIAMRPSEFNSSVTPRSNAILRHRPSNCQ
jgi:hypothetical protein